MATIQNNGFVTTALSIPSPLSPSVLSDACVFPTPSCGPNSVAEPVFMDSAHHYIPLYNVAPLSVVPVLAQRNHFPGTLGDMKYCILPMRWGMSPRERHNSSYSSMYNIPIRDAMDIPYFKSQLLKNRRCVILCAGFFEWQTTLGKSQPYYVYQEKELSHVNGAGDWMGTPIFKLAGVFKKVDMAGTITYSCSILTKDADSRLWGLYPKMPVILDTVADVETWINCESVNCLNALEFLEKYEEPKPPAASHQYTLKFHPVDYRYVNDPGCNSERCVYPFRRGPRNNWFKRGDQTPGPSSN